MIKAMRQPHGNGLGGTMKVEIKHGKGGLTLRFDEPLRFDAHYSVTIEIEDFADLMREMATVIEHQWDCRECGTDIAGHIICPRCGVVQ